MMMLPPNLYSWVGSRTKSASGSDVSYQPRESFTTVGYWGFRQVESYTRGVELSTTSDRDRSRTISKELEL